MNAKKAAGVAAAELIKDGMTVGLGTGSTAYWAIKKIGEKIRQGLRISAIATSKESERLAREVHIPIVNFSEISRDLNQIPGVVENGLFINMAHKMIVGYGTGRVEVMVKNK